jgi:light-regulated signal transduction histidine kinase (bacteriophytochrome)
MTREEIINLLNAAADQIEKDRDEIERLNKEIVRLNIQIDEWVKANLSIVRKMVEYERELTKLKEALAESAVKEKLMWSVVVLS